jgi:hypothetical protein
MPILSVRSKIALLVLAFSTFHSTSVSQLVNDFSIADTGMVPSLAYDLKGGIYVTWENLEDAVHLKHLDSLGRTLSDSISFLYTFASITPRIALNEKNVFVVWQDRLSNHVSYLRSYVIGYAFDPDSIEAGLCLHMDDDYRDTHRPHPDAGFIDDSTFVSVWQGSHPETPNPQMGIYSQICSVSGVPIGGNFLVTDHISNSAQNRLPRLITHEGDSIFTVCWQDNSSGRYEIYARNFLHNGTPVDSSFLVSDDSSMTDLWYYSVAPNPNGGFVVGWIADKATGSQIEWRWYDSQAHATTPLQQLTLLETFFNSGSSIDVSVDEQGRSVVVWEQIDQNKSRLFCCRYGIDRQAIGIPFKLTTNAAGEEEYFPGVMLRNNRIYAVWENFRSDGSSGIKANVLDFDNPTSVEREVLEDFHHIDSFMLYANYQNPFNPTTQISYALPHQGHVVIKVYDLLGREIRTLVDGERAAGRYTVDFDATRLTTGIYLYSLEVDGKSMIRKMLLLK